MLITATLASCAAGGGSESSNDYAPYKSEEYYDVEMPEAESYGLTDSDTVANRYSEEKDFGQKIIYNSYLYIETLDFETSYQMILDEIEKSNGYISYSNQSGGQYGDGSYSSKSLSVECRIPIDSYNQFLNSSDSFGNVTRRTDNSQDVTSAYVDIEARLTSLKIQEERLLELVKEAKDIDTLLAIETRLAEVRYEIEFYTSQIKTYDNLIEYSTVTIDLVEVWTLNQTKSFGQEVWEAIVNSFKAVVTVLRTAVIIMIYLLPYGVIALAIYLIIRFAVKRSRNKKAKLAGPVPDQNTNNKINTGGGQQ